MTNAALRLQQLLGSQALFAEANDFSHNPAPRTVHSCALDLAIRLPLEDGEDEIGGRRVPLRSKGVLRRCGGKPPGAGSSAAVPMPCQTCSHCCHHSSHCRYCSEEAAKMRWSQACSWSQLYS